MPDQVILVIGEVYVDTHLDIAYLGGPLVRLGGIFHSARAFAAINTDYALAYFAPQYLDEDINIWSLHLNTKGCYKIGNVDRSPNVMLVSESTEAGYQGYYDLLKDQAVISFDSNDLVSVIEKVMPTDILIYPGRYNVNKILNELTSFKGSIHIDLHYDYENVDFDNFQSIESVILSTSSILFRDVCHGAISEVERLFSDGRANKILVKENRGGSICYLLEESSQCEAPAYYVSTMHSVGVGDVYNAVFISDIFSDNLEKKMRFAALCASKYAETMDYDRFKGNVNLFRTNDVELLNLVGTRLSWEIRRGVNVYLAAPDFPDVDTKILDNLREALIYHNFSPRLPIRENGLCSECDEENPEVNLYYRDVNLLRECSILIAVLLFNDPGTLVELGMFKQMNKPTIVYDPHHICTNMFVRYTPDYIVHSLSEVIESVFLCAGGDRYNG